MRLVVEGTERLRRIISVGLDDVNYVLETDQELRIIQDWKGRRKSECYWDEEIQAIIDKVHPDLLMEIEAAKNKKTSEEEITILKERLDKLEKIDEPTVPEGQPGRDSGNLDDAPEPLESP